MTRHRHDSPFALFLTLPLAALACASDDAGPSGSLDPGHMGELVAERLKEVGAIGGGETGLEFEIFDLEAIALDGDVTPTSCDAVDQSLATVCDELIASGGSQPSHASRLPSSHSSAAASSPSPQSGSGLVSGAPVKSIA